MQKDPYGQLLRLQDLHGQIHLYFENLMEQNMIQVQQVTQRLVILMVLQHTLSMKPERIKLKQEQDRRLQQVLNQAILI